MFAVFVVGGVIVLAVVPLFMVLFRPFPVTPMPGLIGVIPVPLVVPVANPPVVTPPVTPPVLIVEPLLRALVPALPLLLKPPAPAPGAKADVAPLIADEPTAPPVTPSAPAAIADPAARNTIETAEKGAK